MGGRRGEDRREEEMREKRGGEGRSGENAWSQGMKGRETGRGKGEN